jgi:hypothetical protein
MATGMRLAKLLAMLALVNMPPPPLPLVKPLPPLDKVTLPLVKLSMLTLDRMLEELERPVFRLIVVNPLLVLVLHTPQKHRRSYNQSFGSGSALILVGMIRIRIGNADSDPDQGGQTGPTKYKNLEMICFQVADVFF